jgi:inosine-uridine nucleoside N-ribohydrolase
MNQVLGLLSLTLAALPALLDEADGAASYPVFIDTDIGADDAVAIGWMLLQPQVEITGITTVHGNTTVEHATRNILTLLAAAGQNVPVTIGEPQPLEGERLRTGALVHGPDGFWFAQQPLDISGLPTDAPAAIAAQARANPATTFIALGPLTNFAHAVERFPEAMAGTRIIALGGGTRGNATPLAEFNIYADPLALEIVLEGNLHLELITLDAFDQLHVHTEQFITLLGQRGDALGGLLAHAIGGYARAQSILGGDTIAIPDAAAVIYALYPHIAKPTSALLQVITDEGKARGQTIIGRALGQRLPMIAGSKELGDMAERAVGDPSFNLQAELGAILVRQPDNAQVITELDARQAAELLIRGLRRA